MFLQLLTGLSLLKVVLGVYCDKTYTASYGTVSSPSFSTSSYYDNNLDCKYDIRVNSFYGIKLQWSMFGIKGKMPNCYDDYVEIFIGCQRHSIGKYCSENLYGNNLFTVYSPDNCLHLKFHSDSSGADTGFEATYSSFSRTSVASGIGADCLGSEKFPKTLSSRAATISSPRWPRDYPTLKDCYWRIDVPSGKNIKIAFMDFDLEYDFGCSDDKLKIKGGYSGDSYDGSSTIKDSMCGSKNPFYLTSTKRRIWIRFKSDSFSVSDRGFVAGYVTYDGSSSGTGGSSGSSTTGIVTGVIVVLIIIVCIVVGCAYRRRAIARRQQHGGVIAHVTAPPQQMTVHHPPPPTQPAGYAPPPQQGYAPPPQQGYMPPPQPGYAPPPYSQVAGTPYPPPDNKPGPYPAAPPGGAPPYPPGQPGAAPPYPPGQPGVAPPYPPGQPGAAPPYPPGQPGVVPPYPPEQPPRGAAPYPTAPPSTGTAPYPPQ